MPATTEFNPLHDRWWRILGVSAGMYIVSMVDRTNIAMAIPAMKAELGLDAAQIGFASGMFFIGYVVLQIPCGRLASVWSAKRVICCLMILWGLVSASTALVHTETGLIVNRFALGIVEGGVLTSTIVLIRHWFTKSERARANTVFLLSLPLGSVIGNPISGLVLGVADWHWMFVIEAVPALAGAAFWWLLIDDRPARAAWLAPDERAAVERALALEETQVAPAAGHWLKVAWNPAVLLIAAYNFLALMANWGVTIWLPSLLKGLGLSDTSVGFLSAIPFLAGAIAMILVARSSDRRRERKWHVAVMTALSGVFLIGGLLLGQTSVVLALAIVTASFACFFGRFGPFWALPAEVLPPSVAGVGIAVVNGLGNLGGFSGPFVFGRIRDTFGSFNLALLLAAILLIAAGGLLAFLRTAPEPRYAPGAAPAE